MATSLAPLGSVTGTSEALRGDSGAQSRGGVPAETDQTPDKQTFLTLLVAQIKNQDPLNPADGTQFVAQLAQFSELEQVIAIRKDVRVIREAIEGTTGARQDTPAPEPGKVQN